MIRRLLKTFRHSLADRARDNAYLIRLVRDDLYVPDPKALKMYVIVRSDVLPPINQGIQLAHAVVEFGISEAADQRFDDWSHDHKTIVALGVHSEKEYYKIQWRAHKRGVLFVDFMEPDLDNMLTAAAFMPMTSKEAKDIFYGLRLAS